MKCVLIPPKNSFRSEKIPCKALSLERKICFKTNAYDALRDIMSTTAEKVSPFLDTWLNFLSGPASLQNKVLGLHKLGNLEQIWEHIRPAFLEFYKYKMPITLRLKALRVTAEILRFYKKEEPPFGKKRKGVHTKVLEIFETSVKELATSSNQPCVDPEELELSLLCLEILELLAKFSVAKTHLLHSFGTAFQLLNCTSDSAQIVRIIKLFYRVYEDHGELASLHLVNTLITHPQGKGVGETLVRLCNMNDASLKDGAVRIMTDALLHPQGNKLLYTVDRLDLAQLLCRAVQDGDGIDVVNCLRAYLYCYPDAEDDDQLVGPSHFFCMPALVKQTVDQCRHVPYQLYRMQKTRPPSHKATYESFHQLVADVNQQRVAYERKLAQSVARGEVPYRKQ